MQFRTTHLQPTSSKYALIKRYEFLHYGSFWKVNKNTFWVKASCMNMEDPIEMKPKGLCDTVAEPTVLKMLVCVLHFIFVKCHGKQESPLTFISSNRKGKKAQKNSFFEIFWVRGVDYRKGKVLSPFLSMVFHGLLSTYSYFKLLLCVFVLKSFVLLRFNPCFCPLECYEVIFENFVWKVFVWKTFVCLSKYLGTNLPTRKSFVRFPFDNAIPLLRNK